MRKFILLFFCWFAASLVNAQKTYTNPLLPSGADPWVTYEDGYYYYTNTTGRNVTIWKTKNIVDLKSAEKKSFGLRRQQALTLKKYGLPKFIVYRINGMHILRLTVVIILIIECM